MNEPYDPDDVHKLESDLWRQSAASWRENYYREQRINSWYAVGPLLLSVCVVVARYWHGFPWVILTSLAGATFGSALYPWMGRFTTWRLDRRERRRDAEIERLVAEDMARRHEEIREGE